MAKVIFGITLVLLLTTLSSTITNAQSTNKCTNHPFQSNNKQQQPNYKNCVDLPSLNSFLHYTYSPATETLDIAYRHPVGGGTGPATSKWVVWAINPTSQAMVGSQALVAYRSPKDGTLTAYTSPITSYGTTLEKGDLSFNVSELKAEFSNGEIVIFATIKVSINGSSTQLNQVWQEGPLSSDGTPRMHSLSGDNVRSMASLDLLSGVVSPTNGGSGGVGTSWKNTHGVINTMSWGILMPLGVIIARYVKFFPSADPAWFYLHVGCQLTAYILGVAGWATGLKLTSGPQHIHHPTHRCIGTTIFSMATLQVLALFVRPKKDHKYRVYWNVYHHTVGYATIILGVYNIFEGFRILKPDNAWRLGYGGVLLGLVVSFVVLEATTWYLSFTSKKVVDVAEENKSSINNV